MLLPWFGIMFWVASLSSAYEDAPGWGVAGRFAALCSHTRQRCLITTGYIFLNVSLLLKVIRMSPFFSLLTLAPHNTQALTTLYLEKLDRTGCHWGKWEEGGMGRTPSAHFSHSLIDSLGSWGR